MMELTSDPESIQFQQGQRISLPLLKNEIDRRLLKITCLARKLHSRKHNSSRKHTEQCHRQVQTEPTHSQDPQCPERSVVLAVVNQEEQLNRKQHSGLKQNRKQTERPSNGKRQSQTKPPQQQKVQGVTSTVEENGMIESNGFTFRDVGHDGSSAKQRRIRESQEDKIFQSLDFGLTISNVEMCRSVTSEGQLQRFRTNIREETGGRREMLTVSSFTELSGSDLGREVSRRNRRIRTGSRQVVLPEPQKRFLVSEECRQRMQRQVEQLFSRKRKQACDYKLRMNVLKKIEEKYGQEYSI